MKTALITGGLGFIGSNLVKILIDKKIVSRCILLDSFASFVNPLKDNFADFRKYWNIADLMVSEVNCKL